MELKAQLANLKPKDHKEWDSSLLSGEGKTDITSGHTTGQR